MASHLKLLANAGAINGVMSDRAIETFDEVRAMTWLLLNRRKWLEASPAALPDAVAVHCLCRCLLPLSLSLPQTLFLTPFPVMMRAHLTESRMNRKFERFA